MAETSLVKEREYWRQMTKEEINFNIRHVVNLLETSLFLAAECGRLEAVVKKLENKNNQVDGGEHDKG